AVSGIIVTVFLGGWNGPVLPFLPIQLTSLIYFMIKTYAVIFFTMWLRATVPRMRIDQLLNLGWKIMIPLALLNLLIAAFVITAGVI
ncbi:MAG: NADH-quinone oxidoreductase subunit H, partial [Candidatus Methanoperedens sp.]|nr:NADH-quinone oxidoreductase subunit H [Candidatus Methanoperedens sp.]